MTLDENFRDILNAYLADNAHHFEGLGTDRLVNRLLGIIESEILPASTENIYALRKAVIPAMACLLAVYSNAAGE